MKNTLILIAMLCWTSFLNPSIAFVFRSDSVAAHWDTWCIYHEGTFYTYYLITEYGYGEGVGLATSGDGVHWKDHGRVIHQSDKNTFYLGSGSVWKSPDFEQNGKFICNYSEHRKDRKGKNTQNILFAWSTDLVNWNKYDDSTMFKVDTVYYKKYGRWDCIFTFPREEGGYWGTWSANAKNVKGSVGIGYTEDGVSWKVLPPPDVETGANESGAFYPINGKVYSMFIGHPDRGMWSHFADNIHGPYLRSPKNAHLLVRGPTAFARFLPTPDGLLAHHYHWTGARLIRSEKSVGRDRELTYVSPFKQVEVDHEGILRWKYWKGNEALKGDKLNYFSYKEGVKTNAVNFNKGVIAEMDVCLPAKGSEPLKIVFETSGLNYAVTINDVGNILVGKINASGDMDEKFHLANREWQFNKIVKLRLFLRAGMMEAYLDDHFMECWTLGCYGVEKVTLNIPDNNGLIENILLWEMSLEPAKIAKNIYIKKE